MAGRGRPPSPRAALARIVCMKLRLYPGEDDDLIAFFDAMPDRVRAAMVKRGLCSGVRSAGGVSLSEKDDDLFSTISNSQYGFAVGESSPANRLPRICDRHTRLRDAYKGPCEPSLPAFQAAASDAMTPDAASASGLCLVSDSAERSGR